MVKGHVKERQREWRRMTGYSPEQTGKPNLEGWEALASFFASGGGSVQRGGERLVAV